MVDDIRLAVLPAPKAVDHCGWYEKFLVAATRPGRTAAAADDADVIVPPYDLEVAHYPSFLGELGRTGESKADFFRRRFETAVALGEWFAVVSRRLRPAQRVLLLDVESALGPCSRILDTVKRDARGTATVHVTICAERGDYRPGGDVSFPAVLPAATARSGAVVAPARRRRLLAAFKGRRTYGLRGFLYELHDGGANVVAIDALADGAGKYGYAELLADATFALCPRGDSVFSFRFAEALSYGSIPVVYGDDWVLPFSELLDPQDYCIVLREEDALHTHNVLKAIDSTRIDNLQASGLAIFHRYFSTINHQLNGLCEILRRRRQDNDATHVIAVDVAERWTEAPDAGERALLGRIQHKFNPRDAAGTANCFGALCCQGTL